MPSHPPDTEFYDEPRNAALWRDLSRTFENFAGEDEARWPERREVFTAVAGDVLNRLKEAE
jgi:hypothetical protein